MAQQNQRLHCELQGSQIKILTPGNKLIKRKLCQIQNKAYFFQGQLNPLITENQKLKAQLTSLNKTVTCSTDLLRSLLPFGSSESKRLKLQLANIEQISEMIQQDWHMMQDQIQRKAFTIQVLEKKMISNGQKYQTELLRSKQQAEIIIAQKQSHLRRMQEEAQKAQRALEHTILKYKKEINEVRETLRLRVEKGQKLQTQFQIYKRQVQNRYRDYDKMTNRLKDQISSNITQFQESKRNLREIYEKLMGQKLSEQAQGFNLLLKAKQEQKDRLVTQYQQKEEELQKYLNQKSETIDKLEQISYRQKEQLRKKQELIQQAKKSILQLQGQIYKAQQKMGYLQKTVKSTEERLQVVQRQFLQKQNVYIKQLKQQGQKHSKFQSQLKQKIIKLQKTFKELNQDLVQKTQRLKITQKSLVTAERRFNKKLEQEQQKWQKEKLILEREKLQLEQKYQSLQHIISIKQGLIQQKINQLEQKEKEHDSKLSQLEQIKMNQLQQVKNSYERQIKLINEQSSQQSTRMKRQNQRLLSEQRIKCNKQIQRSMVQCNLKLGKSQEEFNLIRKNFGQEISLKNAQIMQRTLEVQSMATKFQDTQRLVQEMRLQHQLEVTNIRKQSEKMLELHQKIKQQQKKKIQQQMVNQLMQFQTQMQQKQALYESTLKKIQNQMMNQINMLKSSNALQQMQAKFISEIQKERSQHQNNLITLQQRQERSQQNLINEQRQRIQQLIAGYEQDMTKLAQKLQQDIEKLNDELVFQQHDHEIILMTRQQKISYLSKKIHELKSISEEKETRILQLQLQIQRYKKQQEKIKEIIEQKVNQRKLQLQAQKVQFKRQCESTVDRTRIQANKKVNEVERDRLQHTQGMYDQFSQLKQFHTGQIRRLYIKYNQLQKLFAQRPSRAQDLTKIKQLTQIKQKMDLQMVIYHKKVQHANQIVKYLNLQLSNYKDTYDIFGPSDETLDRPSVYVNNGSQSPVKGIMQMRKISQPSNTQKADIYSSQYQTFSPKHTAAHYKRLNNDTSEVKQFKPYSYLKQNQSQNLLPPIDSPPQQQKSGNQNKYRKYKQQTKRGKSLDKSGEIVMNAENFLSLIRNNSKNKSPSIRENKSNERRAYRKIRPRRINTLGLDSVQVYSNIRKKNSYQKDTLQ